MKNKAVIFDMDGIIFDSERLILDCWEKVGEKYQIANIREVCIDCTGTNSVKTREIICSYYGEDFAYDKYRKEADELFREYVRTKGMPVKIGVRELLQYLQAEKIPIGLASSTRLAIVEEELRMTGLYDYFQVVMGGDQLKRSKPEPDIYLLTCEKMGIVPECAYAIEDSYNGIRSAYSAGMMPIMVPDILPADDEMKEKSVAVLQDLLKVKQYFQEEGCPGGRESD
ncbi:MAG: HAD family phosphatase [Lachnospiraceae bacterium]|nr:HAD family phosphatase [Lachnospiraceae bacterium]